MKGLYSKSNFSCKVSQMSEKTKHRLRYEGGAGCYPCAFNLVTGPYGVSVDAFTASSTHSHCPIKDVRLNSTNAWCPLRSIQGQYIQVEFQTVSEVKAIQTRGRVTHHPCHQWVTSYKVNTSIDGSAWSNIVDPTSDKIKVFRGNFDGNTIVSNWLDGIVLAKYIRVIPVSGHNHFSLRLEVKGCPVSDVHSTCQKWKAMLGASGDVFRVNKDVKVSNQGLCGLECYRQEECDSFMFDIVSNILAKI
ncbi:neurexin-4-like [Ylistrum balloti]|uniref:neurexin-4-like n=1 Tax=Ylistrum balloti TaxID=509963 RepID=UPI002905E54B|nr:neurexin-4-like [Ylistrum balloti]